MSDQATFEDFQRIDIRAGRVVAVDDFPEARSPLDDAKGVVLLRPDDDVEPGDRIG